MAIFSLAFVISIFIIFNFEISFSLDTLASSQFLKDGSTLVSNGGAFELGFFSPDNSSDRYLGIWYGKMPVRTVTWVANRNSPINGTSGFFTINGTGNPVLVSENTTVWSAPNLTKSARNSVLQLLDSGNIVLRERDDTRSDDYLWQSFDYPSDTLLPGMKLGWDLKSGLNRYLVSWKSSDDPTTGDLTWKLELQSNPELVIWKGNKKFYRSGPWNGVSFSGAPTLTPNKIFEFEFVWTDKELYYIFYLKNESVLSRIVMNQTTNDRRRYTWNYENQSWSLYDVIPRDRCDDYGLCGAYGNCVVNKLPICQCLQGFIPESPNKWNLMDWSDGCVRNKPIGCQDGKADRFARIGGLKLPDATHSWVDKTMNLEKCKSECLKNCSCMAYSSLDMRGKGSGCAIWFGNLIDIRQFQDGGQDLYIRMNASEVETPRPKIVKRAAIVLATIVIVAGLLLTFYCINKRKAKYAEETYITTTQYDHQNNGRCENEDLELPQFELGSIVNATNNFSAENKIGKGGFGPVYRGVLIDGTEVAVKKLSRSSGQGLCEFKNEVIFIAKLQHRNLVKLLGCCIEGDQKLLVYEYMPNSSLDSFIFDKIRSKLLDWTKRYNIICGIVRGLLYLHQDSRLRIIHRDLKTSNILLDKELNPKISDFGLAKTFGGEQSVGSTNKVVGTYGYMAPEYATDGIFSVKSDVFSFGILLLEIISGKRSTGFCNSNANQNLIGHAWKLSREGNLMDLVDPVLVDSCNISQVIRCVHISLLCVQLHAEDRPTMASVLLMLGTEISLPEPKEPQFFMDKGSFKPTSSSNFCSSSNDMSFSLLMPR